MDTFPESISAEIHDSDPLGWVWKTELETHKRLLALARSQLQQLERCIKGEKVMDRCSLQLSELLQRGQVPEEWSGKHIRKTIEEFLEVFQTRAEFFKVKLHRLIIAFNLFLTTLYHHFLPLDEGYTTEDYRDY